MALEYNYPYSAPSTQTFDETLAVALTDPASAYPLTGIPGSQTRTVEERDHDRINSFEFMTRAQQADLKAGTALSNISAALDVRAALQAQIDYCQPRGIEAELPPYPMRIDANPAAGTGNLLASQKGLTCITSGSQVPGLRIKGAGPLATRLIPNFTDGVVLDIDGASPIYSFQRTGWLRQFSIYPATEKPGVIGVRWAGCLHFEVAHVHIQNIGSHAMWFPWRGDKGGNIYTVNPDGWSCGFFNFVLCRFYGNGGWGLLQESGIGGYYFNFDNGYLLLNRMGGAFLSGAGHRVSHSTIATNGQDNPYYGFGVLFARRMGTGANGRLLHCELDSNWAGNIWAQGVNGVVLEGNRHNSWSTQYPGIGVNDKQLRPPVHIRVGGSVANSTANRVRLPYNNHRSQNVAAGAVAEGAVVWYAIHDSLTTTYGEITNPYNDSQSANAVRYAQGSGALFTAIISGGAITGYTRVSGGLGYFGSATAFIAGGVGSGATGTPVIDGQVIEVVPIDPGLGYPPNTTVPVTFSGGGGSGVVAHGVVDEWGQVTNYVVDSGGTAYTSAPTGTVPAPSVAGTQRQATLAVAFSKVIASITPGAGGTLYDSANPPYVGILPSDLRGIAATNFKYEIIDSGAVAWSTPTQAWLHYRDTGGTNSIPGTGTTPAIVKFGTAIGDAQGLYSVSTGQVTVPYTGAFHGYAKVGIVGLAAGELVSIGIYESGTARVIGTFKAQGITALPGGGAANDSFILPYSYQFAKGAPVDVRCLTNHGTALNTSTVVGETMFEFSGVR